MGIDPSQRLHDTPGDGNIHAEQCWDSSRLLNPVLLAGKAGGQVFKFSVWENRRWVVMGVTYPKNRL